MKRAYKRLKHQVLQRFFPNYFLQQRQIEWNTRWSRDEFVPAWRIAEIPTELQQAVDTEWFPAGATVLDIGCGSGEIAAWLAQQNYKVLGVDFAEGAIAKARSIHGEIAGRLAFQVVDVCRAAPMLNQFDILIDRGCLHVIPTEFHAAYVQYIAQVSKAEARFLLFHKYVSQTFVNRHSAQALPDQTTQRIHNLFAEKFVVERIDTTMIRRDSGQKKQAAPGVAAWMIRRT